MKRTIIWLIPWFLMISLHCYGTIDSITGKICMVGNEPFTRLVCRTDSGQYTLIGDLVTELKQLQGFEVKLKGEISKQSFGSDAKFIVREYQLLIYDDNGILKDSWVGIIKARRGKLYLETTSGMRYRLSGKLLFELKKYDGIKLWVTGKLSKNGLFGKSTLTVDSYGIIRSNSRVMNK